MNMEILKSNFTSKNRIEEASVVATNKNRIHDAILSAMDDLVTPRVELPMK